MADPYTNPLTQQYQSYQAPIKTKAQLQQSGAGLANILGATGNTLQLQGMGNLYEMLANQGRMDPRILARQQAINARSTQQQQDAARADAARRGLGGGGVNQAIQAAIGSAGANRAADFNYRDIADSYARNQQNLGILNQNVTNPTMDLLAMARGQYNADRARKDSQIGGYAQLLGTIAAAFACKVAKEKFGDNTPEFHAARSYVLKRLPADQTVQYMVHGDELVQAYREKPDVKARLDRVFDEFARRGAEMED